VLRNLHDAGLSRRAAEEALGADPRDLDLNLKNCCNILNRKRSKRRLHYECKSPTRISSRRGEPQRLCRKGSAGAGTRAGCGPSCRCSRCRQVIFVAQQADADLEMTAAPVLAPREKRRMAQRLAAGMDSGGCACGVVGWFFWFKAGMGRRYGDGQGFASICSASRGNATKPARKSGYLRKKRMHRFLMCGEAAGNQD